MADAVHLPRADELFERLGKAMRDAPADGVELVVEADRTEVTRFANSEIHQSVSQANVQVAVRVAVGKATARLVLNSLERDELRRAIAEAADLSRLQAPDENFVSLPLPEMGGAQPENPPPSFFEATAALTPAERAGSVAEIIGRARAEDCKAFGTYRSSSTVLAVVSSTGVRAYVPHTTVYLKALLEGPNGTGFADAFDRDANKIDARRVAEQAVAKCKLNRDQREIEPGVYEAVFEPNAVADMVNFAAGHGMGAREVLDGQSFMSGKLGEVVAGEAFTIWDDPHDPRCLPLAIDYEGMPCQRVELVTRGRAISPVYDTQTAYEAGVRTTGHATEPFSDFPSGPLPDHLVMETGTASIEELIANVERGVWVTRFHYTHCPDRKRVIATGTTRDGTFLIENGKVVGALRNLRLEMSVIELMSSQLEAGEGKLCQDWWSANGMAHTNYFLPAIRFGSCNFTGVTTF